MTDDELKLRKAVERAGEHDAQHVGRSPQCASPRRLPRACRSPSERSRYRRPRHRLRQRGGMEIDRDVQRLRALQNWPIELIVEVAPLIVSVDDGDALEALAHS